MSKRRRLLTTMQVADLFGVSASAVIKWVDGGKLAASRTPGGHRRFDPDEVNTLLAETVDATSAGGAR